jgi:hypothetical protein
MNTPRCIDPSPGTPGEGKRSAGGGSVQRARPEVVHPAAPNPHPTLPRGTGRGKEGDGIRRRGGASKL